MNILSTEEFVDSILSSDSIWSVGSGASGIVAEKFAHTLRTIGYRAFALQTEQLLHGDFAGIQSGDQLVICSKSGVLKPQKEFSKMLETLSKPPIVVTENTGCNLPFARCVILEQSKESDAAGIIPTSSFTSMVTYLDSRCVELAERDQLSYLASFALGHPAGGIGSKMTLLAKTIDFEPVVTVEESKFYTPAEIELLLSESQVGTIALVDRNGQFLDVLTDGDVRRFLTDFRDSLTTPISASAIKRSSVNDPITSKANCSIQELIVSFRNNPQVTCIPLISDNGAPVGMVHTKHLIQALRKG